MIQKSPSIGLVQRYCFDRFFDWNLETIYSYKIAMIESGLLCY